MDFICKRISHHFNARNLYIPCHFKCRIFIRKLTLIHVSIVFMSEKFTTSFSCSCSVPVHLIWLSLECIHLMDFMQKINIFKNQATEQRAVTLFKFNSLNVRRFCPCRQKMQHIFLLNDRQSLNKILNTILHTSRKNGCYIALICNILQKIPIIYHLNNAQPHVIQLSQNRPMKRTEDDSENYNVHNMDVP